MWMSIEGSTIQGVAPDQAPAPEKQPPVAQNAGTDAVTRSDIQILTAEHASLVASRALSWNETFSRASMFLATLSGTIVALALAGQGTGFGPAFFILGIVILPVVLFIGVATFIRMGASNYYDAQCIIGMNRIRAGYLEVAPHLERFFVMGTNDDVRGIGITMGYQPGGSQLVHLLASTPVVIGVVNSMIAAAVVGLVSLAIGLAAPILLLLSVIAWLIAFGLHAAYGARAVATGQASARPLFPGPFAE
jgi:hypothetical protein